MLLTCRNISYIILFVDGKTTIIKLNAKFTLDISVFSCAFIVAQKATISNVLEKIIKGGFKMLYLRICEVAKKQGYSIRKIERICNFSNGTIRKWKNNDNAPARKLQQVAQLLNITVDELLKKWKRIKKAIPPLT